MNFNDPILIEDKRNELSSEELPHIFTEKYEYRLDANSPTYLVASVSNEHPYIIANVTFQIKIDENANASEISELWKKAEKIKIRAYPYFDEKFPLYKMWKITIINLNKKIIPIRLIFIPAKI